MSDKIGRNEPYGRAGDAAATVLPLRQREHEGAVERAMSWLMGAQPQGFRRRVRDTARPPAAAAVRHHQRRRPRLRHSAAAELGESLLARGEMLVKGEPRSINAWLLGDEGPRITPGQRRWIEQLAAQALRLYTVTDVCPVKG